MVEHTCDVIKNVRTRYVCRREWSPLGRDRLFCSVDVIPSPTFIPHNLLIIRIFDCWLSWDSFLHFLDIFVSLGNVRRHFEWFTFMSLCIVIDFFLINKLDAIIIPILFCYKTLHVSGIFSVHHQKFYTVHSALVSFVHVSDDRFQAESGWSYSSILTLLGNGHQKPAWNLPVPDVQQKIPDDEQRRCPKHVEFYSRINLG